MKKALISVIIITFAISVLPTFAAQDTKTASGETQKKSIFQQASDDISGIGKTDTPIKKTGTEIFQESMNSIKAGSPDAKSLSLRGNKSELKRRRGEK